MSTPPAHLSGRFWDPCSKRCPLPPPRQRQGRQEGWEWTSWSLSETRSKIKLINNVKLQHLYFSFKCQWGSYFLYSCFCPLGVHSVGKGCSHLTIICFTYLHKLVHIGALQTQTSVQCVSYMQLFLPLGGCTLLSVGRYRLVCFASFTCLTLEFVTELSWQRKISKSSKQISWVLG